MQKKWLKGMAAIMAAAAICGAFAGCGGDKKANGSASGEQIVKFGFLGAYTGPAAAYGQAMKEGTELAVEEINKDPNTKMKIDLKTYDTKGNKAEAINAMKKCIEQDKVLAIEGPTLPVLCSLQAPLPRSPKSLLSVPAPRPPELQTWVIIFSETPSPAKWLSPLP